MNQNFWALPLVALGALCTPALADPPVWVHAGRVKATYTQCG